MEVTENTQQREPKFYLQSRIFLEIGLSVVDWIGLAQDRYRWRALVNSVMNLWVP
jgi:hypothetical protein